MSDPTERAYRALKVKRHKLGEALRKSPNDKRLRAEYHATDKAYHNAGEALRRERGSN
jgi:hypothetical protein